MINRPNSPCQAQAVFSQKYFLSSSRINAAR